MRMIALSLLILTYSASASLAQSARKTDILFVVDNSSSMSEEQAKLKDAVLPFLAMLYPEDVRIGVITTDSPCLVMPDMPSSLLTPNLSSRLETAVKPGIFGSPMERPTHFAMLALFEDNDCPEGQWLRPDAKVGVIVLSDEDEGTDDPLAFVQMVADTLADHGYQPGQQIRFHGIFSLLNQPCDTAYTAATTLKQLVDLSGGQAYDICLGSFSIPLMQIAEDLIQF